MYSTVRPPVSATQNAGLSAIARQLTTQCANCHGQPSAGFARLACGAAIVTANGSHPMS
jgi:mono/diheme cytochrome c family protein